MASAQYHSNLGLYGAQQQNQSVRHSQIQEAPGLDIGDIDGTPMTVAAIGALALIALIALKRAGFRFDFGLSASAGK